MLGLLLSAGLLLDAGRTPLFLPRLMSALAINGGTPVRTEPFHPWPLHDERERDGLLRVLETGNWGGFPSPNVEASAFAAAFAARHGAEFGVCAANGTVTLHLALRAGGVVRGDEVILTPLTFMATAGAVLYVGGVPVFADVDPDDYCLDPKKVEEQITGRTKAVICVHLGASVADLDGLTELCKKRGLVLIEDCAHMHGSEWRGKGIGSWGDFGSFSFQSSKLMTAGEGGMVLTSNKQFEKRLQMLNNCGRREPGYEDTPHWVGHNYRMTEFQAAVLRAQLERLDEQNQKRVRGYDRLAKQLDEIPGVTNLRVDERVTTRGGYQFIFRHDPEAFAGKKKGRVLEALSAEGLAVYEGYTPLNRAFGDSAFDWGEHLFPYKTFSEQWYDSGANVPSYEQVHCPVAERAAQQSIWIPHQVFLGSDADIDSVAEAVAKVQKNASEL